MSCIFKNSSNLCFQIKEQCNNTDNTKCKYYKRQKPNNKTIYNIRYKKALKKALKHRDIFQEFFSLYLIEPDYDITIYENINNTIQKINSPEVLKKEKRPITKEDLQGNILNNITSNLYIIKSIKILKKFEENNSIIIEEEDRQYLCYLKESLSDFFNNLRKSRKKYKYFESKIKRKVEL